MTENHQRPLRVASVFTGCGGMDFGFHKSADFTIVYANDINKDACDTYEQYYKHKAECIDICTIKSIPDCDVLIGGFPCQGFSIANINRRENDERNKLYLELIRLLKLKKPKYFIFENVKGILSLGGYETADDKQKQTGRIFKTILNDFRDCGYNVHTKLFNMKLYGIPQNRERVIFFGIRNDLCDVVVEWPPESNTSIKTLKDAIGDLSVEYDPHTQHIGTKHKVKITGYVGNRKLDWNKESPCIMGRGGGTGGPVINVHPSGERRMTVREYARIQTFPDDFMFCGSVSSMYKQIGNAVPPTFSILLCQLIVNIDNQIES